MDPRELAVLVGERRVEHRRVVGVDGHEEPAIEERADRVRRQIGHDACADVGDRAHLEGNLPRGDHLDERGIFGRACAMADAVGAQHLEGVPYARGTCRLTRVRARPEPQPSRPLEGRGEGRRRKRVLAPADADANHTRVLHLGECVERTPGLLRPEVAHEIRDEVDDDSGDAIEAAAKRLDNSADREAARREVRGRAERLGVEHVLLEQRAAGRLGDEREVVELAQEAVLPHPRLDEVGEVAVAEARLELVQRARRARVVLAHELEQRRKRDRALQVDVELHLRDCVEPATLSGQATGGRSWSGIIAARRPPRPPPPGREPPQSYCPLK